MTKKAKATEPKRRKRRRVVLFVLLALTGLFIADYFAFPWGSDIHAPKADKGTNGLWVRYTYYFGQKTDAEIESLAKRTQECGIRWAYFHVRSIEATGKLKYRYPDQAKRMLTQFRKHNGSTQALAWIYAGNPKGAGHVSLGKGDVRKAMVSEAVWLVKECGFDGVQWDYEICDDGDQNLLKLLEETRDALPSGTPLGVCAPAWLPVPGFEGWSKPYIAEVAKRCDQIAVMNYDTGFFTPRSYVWLTQKQVPIFTSAAYSGNPSCKILVGVPTYGPGLRSHNPRAENIEMALRGVREGLTLPGVKTDSFAGVSLFAEYTTGTSEWEGFERLWMHKAHLTPALARASRMSASYSPTRR